MLIILFAFLLSSTAITDSDLASNIKRAIQNDHDLTNYGRSVQVTVDGGVVTLKGEVRGEREKKKIARLVKKTKGVLKVDNKLTTTFGGAAN